MSGTGLPGGATDAAALAALHAQAARLDRIAARLAPLVASLPTHADDEWRGPARAAFDLAVVRLQQLVTAASACVDEALAETRRAITTMGGWR